jgi:hypothetical protein
MSAIAENMVTSFIGVECHFQQYVSYKVQHGDQFYCCLMPLSTLSVITDRPALLVLNATFNNMSVLTYNMETSFIGAYCHFQQDVSYNV